MAKIKNDMKNPKTDIKDILFVRTIRSVSYSEWINIKKRVEKHLKDEMCKK